MTGWFIFSSHPNRKLDKLDMQVPGPESSHRRIVYDGLGVGRHSGVIFNLLPSGSI